MKNVLLTISVVFNVIALIIILWCCKCRHSENLCHKNRNEKDSGPAILSKTRNSNTYLWISNGDTCSTCYDMPNCGSQLKCVSACFAEKLVQNYRDHHWSESNSNIEDLAGRLDSRAVWFSMDKLKRFIYEVESKTCNLPPNSCVSQSQPALGVRFYFGEYPATGSPDWNNYPELTNPQNYCDGCTVPAGYKTMYPSLHTLVMVPTYNNGSVNVDFDPNTGCGFNCTSPWDTTSRAGMPILIPEIANHGDMIPPPWDYSSYLSAGATFMAFSDLDRYPNNYLGTTNSPNISNSSGTSPQ